MLSSRVVWFERVAQTGGGPAQTTTWSGRSPQS
jgi:hypothetical protein